jgi:curved DNA-binding protein CbpA
MGSADSSKDYYGVLGVDDGASKSEIERQYKREAAKHHPDRGGTEERMKSLNEAYSVLRDAASRRQYDDRRRPPTAASGFVPASTPAAGDIGLFGHCLSALLCLSAGLFLLLLVRFQWIWFLWPLAILALFVISFGVLMARSALRAVNKSLPESYGLRRHTRLQELAFWVAVGCGGYAVYWVLAQ